MGDSPQKSSHVRMISSPCVCAGAIVMIRTPSLMDLPYELLVKILEHLWPDELYTCMQVCKSLRHAAQDTSLWTHLDLYHIRQCRHRVLKSTEGLLTLLRHSPQLHTLRGVDTFPFDESYLKQVKKLCPLLKVFDVGHSNVTWECVRTLLNTPKPWYLEELGLSGINLLNNADFHQELPDEILTSLRVINLEHCEDLTQQCVVSLAATCPRLTHLNLNGVRYLSDFGVEAITTAIGDRLQSLQLDGEALSDPSLIAIARHTPHLHDLAIAYCDNMTDASLLTLSSLQSLRTLKLRKGISWSNDAFVSLFCSDNFGNSLVSLDLTESSNLGSGLTCIADSCHKLRVAILSWCWNISNDDLNCLIDNNNELLKLDLTGCKKLQGSFLDSLPVRLPELRVLCLKNVNYVDDASLHRILKGVSHEIVVIGYYGQNLADSDAEWGVSGVIHFKGMLLEY
eukprot:m.355190 g.355190  ORF g.355190 m.355190 type:complete len:454 (-) comp20732_c0_seq3:55-1416(-)